MQFYIHLISHSKGVNVVLSGGGTNGTFKVFPLTQDCTTGHPSSLSSNLSTSMCSTFLFLEGVLRF